MHRRARKEVKLSHDVTVLARGSDWVVVDKPPNIMVHRSALNRDRDAMLQRVRDALGCHVYPVHRLDRATSGCLIFGTSSEGAARMHTSLREGQKSYLTLVRGSAPQLDGRRIERPLKPDGGGEARAATTLLEVLGHGRNPRSTLIRARPETGRFHQIRRHLAGTSHPVLGDSSHGDTKINRFWRETYGLPRLFLHCSTLELSVDGEPVRVHAPLPSDLRSVLERLPWWEAVKDTVIHPSW